MIVFSQFNFFCQIAEYLYTINYFYDRIMKNIQAVITLSKTKSTISLIVTSILFGSGFIATEFGLNDHIRPELIIFLRMLIAALVIYILKYKQINKYFKANLKSGIITGLFLSVGFISQSTGQFYSNPINTAFITSTYVIFVPLCAFLVTKKKLTVHTFLAIVLVVIGTALLTLTDSFHLGLGDSYSIICSITFGIHVFLCGYYGKQETNDTITFTFIQFLASSFFAFFVCLINNSFSLSFSGNGIISVLYLGIFTTCLAFFLQIKSQKYVEEEVAGLILSTESVWGTVMSMLIFKDIITQKQVLGIILIIMAVIVCETKLQFIHKKLFFKNR